METARDDALETLTLNTIYGNPEDFLRKPKVFPGKTFYHRINRPSKIQQRRKVR